MFMKCGFSVGSSNTVTTAFRRIVGCVNSLNTHIADYNLVSYNISIRVWIKLIPLPAGCQ